MGNDATLHAKQSKTAIYLGKAHYLNFLFDDVFTELGKEMDEQTLVAWVKKALDHDDDSGLYLCHRVLALLKEAPQDTYVFADDYTKGFGDEEDDKYTYLNIDIQAAVEKHLNTLEMVIWNGTHGYLAVSKDDWANRSPVELKARLLGVKDRQGQFVYVTLTADDGTWTPTEKYVVSDR